MIKATRELLEVKDFLDREGIKYRYLETGEPDNVDLGVPVKRPRIYVFGENGYLRVSNEYDDSAHYYVRNTGIMYAHVSFKELVDMIHEVVGIENIEEATECEPELKKDLKDIKGRLKKLFDVDGTADTLEKRARNIKARNCYEDIVDKLLEEPEYVYELEAYDKDKRGDEELYESALFKTFEGANEHVAEFLHDVTPFGENLVLTSSLCNASEGFKMLEFSYIDSVYGGEGSKVVRISRKKLN